MSKQQKIPKLRFPGFLGEWEMGRLGDFLQEYVEKTPANTDIPVLTSSRSGLLLQKDYFDDRELQNEGEYKVVPKGYFTYRHMSDDATFIFNINQLVERGAISKEYPVFTTIGMSSFFIHQVLNFGKEFKQFALLMKKGGTRTRLYFRDLKELRLPLPTLLEQQKIAHFLTAIDEKINQLTRQKALLEQYKKGVMQQIFSRELRFRDADGKAFGEWEVRRLGAVFALIITNSFSRNLLNYTDGSVKNIHYGDIHTKYKTNFDVSKADVPFINSDVDLSKISEECYCRIGDLVIADASEDYKDVGKAIEVRKLDKYKLLAGLHTIIARDKDVKTAVGFKGYLMQSDEVRQQIMKMATGVSVLGLSKNNLAQIEIPLPTFPEQQKIADFLTALDEKISRVSGQVEAVKGYKKGVLQGMFV